MFGRLESNRRVVKMIHAMTFFKTVWKIANGIGMQVGPRAARLEADLNISNLLSRR